jgi:hypothetical protein
MEYVVSTSVESLFTMTLLPGTLGAIKGITEQESRVVWCQWECESGHYRDRVVHLADKGAVHPLIAADPAVAGKAAGAYTRPLFGST